MNEIQNSNEKEINLLALLFYCLKKWRWIAGAMAAAALLSGGYQYLSAAQIIGGEKIRKKKM